MTRLMKTKAFLAPLVLATAAAGLAGCTSAKAMCTVRHHYAIVIFQNDTGNISERHVTQFRLNIWYGSYRIQHWPMTSSITLRPANGGNPPIIVRTYRVGNASSCTVDRIRAHQ